jgi:hypothetical protein
MHFTIVVLLYNNTPFLRHSMQMALISKLQTWFNGRLLFHEKAYMIWKCPELENSADYSFQFLLTLLFTETRCS